MTGAAVVGVDVGGSGLRLQVTYAGVPGPVRTSTGVRIGSTGIDVAAAVADARALWDAEIDAAQSTAGDAERDAERDAEPAVVVWSMRGLLFLADRAAVMRQVREGLGGAATVVVSDAVANLVGAVGDLQPGAVVAAGSGAVAFGSDFGQVWHRVDGWGHVLGDVGSGAWIGLEGLRAALRADDALVGGSQRLLGAAVDRFGPTHTWPRQLMAAPDAPEKLASFAPVVSAAAETPPSGAGQPAAANAVAPDPVAADICRRAGRGLAEALLAAAAGLEDPTLVASGGALASPAVRGALVDSLVESDRKLSPAHGGALDGALILGRRLVEVGGLPEHPAYLLVAND
ncbi:MAG: BadF/BadG/BcrA/BcrD ATPase family protein [Pedococcus sp.]